MAKNSRDAYGAVGESKVLFIKPEDLVLVTDEDHPLYDERVHRPVDPKMVASIKLRGIVQNVIARKNTETGKLEIVAGRQRVKNAIQANIELKKEGVDPISVPVVIKRADDNVSMDSMVIENEHRSADSPMARARKMQAMLARGRTEAELAIVFGVTQQTIKNTISLLDASSVVRRAVDSGVIGVADAHKLAKLDPAEQKSKLEELVTMAPKVPGKRRKKGTAGKARRIVSDGVVTELRSASLVRALRAELSHVDAAVKENDRRVALAVFDWLLGDDAALGVFFDSALMQSASTE